MIDTAKYQSRLLEEKETLEHELATVGRRNPSNPNDWEPIQQDTGPEPDPTDQADQLEQYKENAAILTDLEARYNDVLDALKRIEDGTYGICEVSGEEIEEDRLDANPTARTSKAHINQ